MTTEIDQGKGEKLTGIIVDALSGAPVERRQFAPREITVAEKTLTEFDPAAPPAERLYGYAARHFVTAARYMPLTRFDQEEPLAVTNAVRYERLIDASGQFLTGLGRIYAEEGVDSWAIIARAQGDVLSLQQQATIPAVSVETVQVTPEVL